jgi:transposase
MWSALAERWRSWFCDSNHAATTYSGCSGGSGRKEGDRFFGAAVPGEIELRSVSGCLFIFRNRSARAIRILAYDGQGFWLATKRLSKGRFRWWPTGAEASRSLRAHQAQLLLAGGDPETDAAPIWRRVSV